MPRNESGRTQMVSFRGVVVDHVQNHFDTGTMQGPHHALKFRGRLLPPTKMRHISAPERNNLGCYTPNNLKALLFQVPVVGKIMNGHELFHAGGHT